MVAAWCVILLNLLFPRTAIATTVMAIIGHRRGGRRQDRAYDRNRRRGVRAGRSPLSGACPQSTG